MRAPLLIDLPCGLTCSGIATWAVRLLNALADRGRPCGLILHPPLPGYAPIDLPLDRRVRAFDAGEVPSYAGVFERAISDLARGSSLPVLISPNLTAESYAAAARVLTSTAAHARLLGWCHLDNEFDRALLRHYEPVLDAFIPVSDHIETQLARDLPNRTGDIEQIPYGVEIPPDPPARRPANALRLLAVSRLDDDIKRATALVHMSDALAARGVEHALTLAGDGPALDSIRAAAASRPRVRVLGAVAPARVPEVLLAHDLFVLPSRREGLSVAMLEALAAGCVPVVARVASGAAQAVRHGRTGFLVDAPDTLTLAQVGACFADVIAPLAEARARAALQAMARDAHADARERFSLETHVRRVEGLLDRVAARPPRPDSARVAPRLADADVTVPRDAADRMRAVLASLAGRRVIIHATGRHTRALAGVFAEFRDRVVAFTDDNPALHTARLFDLPVIAPAHARSVEATDVVVSSCINQGAILARAGVYEQLGIRVHALY